MRASIANLIPYNPGMSSEELEKKLGLPVYKLSANESLWGPSPQVANALKEAVNQLKFYPDGAARQLKKGIQAKWCANSENICLGNGADEIITIITNAFLNPEDEVLIPVPTFSQYETAVTVCGGKCKLVQQSSLTFDLKSIRANISDKTKMVFLCNPNNPTGTYFSHQELVEFLNNVPHNILIVLDEAYCQYATAPDFPKSQELLNKYKNLIVTRTFSKIYSLAALRVGYAVADEAIIKQMEKVRQPFNVNTFSQIAAVAALADHEYYQNVKEKTVEQRNKLTNTLQRLGFEVQPSQANFILAYSPQGTKMAEQLLQKGILIRETTSFGLSNYLRITVGPEEIMNKLQEELEAIIF